ncbi:class I SAM-dependent methyltransferase [Lampropedia puyangensis]|uniref:Class I SAM-dependent methyltransferase n=1 Tax=Lampropedia puyangensis TaxID=1330072 RepID=A0A4S8FAG0_9BURK|nr:class I SAM-dependent methyltransferase [Lampropedia puyangensis]THU03805.1 class I SAM-dependent methyltransferase [Lampropedia puyangensis]
MKKQVDKSHYEFRQYMTNERWASVWHQLDEVLKQKPESVLEIGPGPGIFKSAAKIFGVNVETLDLDPELNPDHVGSADAIPMPDHSFDVVCAFQVLEHMPFEISMKSLREMCRVAKKSVVISLPEAGRCWPNTLSIPYVRKIRFLLRNPFKKAEKHVFDGEHYWEIGKQGYELSSIVDAIRSNMPEYCRTTTYRVHENPYHRFFILDLVR